MLNSNLSLVPKFVLIILIFIPTSIDKNLEPIYNPATNPLIIPSANSSDKINALYLNHFPLIFPNHTNAYNPGVIQLPSDSKYPFLMVGRKPASSVHLFNNDEFMFGEPIYCYGAFVVDKLQCITSETKVNVKPNWNIIESRYRQNIKDASSKYDYQDPRLWYGKYNDKTEMFISFSCPSDHMHQIRTTCTGLAISVIPDLFNILPLDYSLNGNIDLLNINLRDSKDRYVKNVSPISSQSDHFVYSIKPLVIIKHELNPREADALFVEMSTPLCLDIPKTVHLGTNSLHIALCVYPCSVQLEDTRIMFMVHIKIDNIGLSYPIYKRMMVFMHPINYKIMHISPFLEMKGIDPHELIFDLNMNYSPQAGNWNLTMNTLFNGFTFGYLNTPIILTMGVDLKRKGRLAYFNTVDIYKQSYACDAKMARKIMETEFK